MSNIDDLELRGPERTLLAVEVSSRRDELERNKAVPVVVSGSLDIEQKSPPEPATRLRRILALWPWAFFALAGVATLAWAIALGWAAYALVRWLVG
jgi:hypothetical protein